MTDEQRDLFLGELSVSGNVAFAARAAGITREQAVAHRIAEPEFEALWREATACADLLARERMERW